MKHSLMILAMLTGWPITAAEPIVVPSAVVSLIDDVAVASQDGGIVSRSHVREGDKIEAGDLLAELDDLDAQLDRQHVLTELEIAKTEAASQLGVLLAQKSFEVAAAELQRAELSNQKYADSVSRTELDKLRFVRDEAEIQIQHAQEKLQLARLGVRLKEAEMAIADRRLDRRRFRAPLSGTVVRLERQPGEWIQPGETYCRMIRTDRLRAEGFLTVGQGVVRPAQPALLVTGSDDGKPRTYSGVISFIDPEVNPITGQYRVWVEVENPDGTLRPGERVRLEIPPVINSDTP